MARPRTRQARPHRPLAGALVSGVVLACLALAVGPPIRVVERASNAATADPGPITDPGPTPNPAPPRNQRRDRPPGQRGGRRDTTTSPVPPTPPAAQPSDNQNCTLIVPPAPLTSTGLATPYRLRATDAAAGACHETNPNQSAFVEAAILNPDTGAVSIYHPLVVDDGTQPAIAPVRPNLPPRAAVGIWFGFQANTLTLRAKRVNRHRLALRFNPGDPCVNGAPGDPFGQFAYCGAPQFFAAANSAVRTGKLKVPALGTAKDGQPCPTTRDFSVVDQDQSDNLPTKYLALADGRTAQDSPGNRGRLTGATELTNASDNGLLDSRIDPALGCQPFTAPDLSADNTPSPGLALNELQAAADQRAPIALVPPNDPMTQANGQTSVAKTNLYRAGVDQTRVNQATDTGAAYCTALGKVAPARLALDQPFTANAPSPDPAAPNLFDFLTQRLTASWTNLNCQALTGQPAPTVGGGTTPPSPAPATDPTTTPPSAPDPAPGATPPDPAPTVRPSGPAQPDPAGTPAPASTAASDAPPSDPAAPPSG